jgi:hypothetical protein
MNEDDESYLSEYVGMNFFGGRVIFDRHDTPLFQRVLMAQSNQSLIDSIFEEFKRTVEAEVDEEVEFVAEVPRARMGDAFPKTPKRVYRPFQSQIVTFDLVPLTDEEVVAARAEGRLAPGEE